LGVGDAPFQSKCFKRLRALIENGTTILFVSHDISTVRSICSRALWLKHGRAEMWGEAMYVARQYEKYCWEEQGVVIESAQNNEKKLLSEDNVNTSEPSDTSLLPSLLFEPNKAFEKNREQSRIGTGDVIIKNFLILNSEGEPAITCEYNENLRLYYLLEASRPVNTDIVLGFRVRDLHGNFVYSANDISTIHKIEANPGDRFVITTNINIPLTHQNYVILTGIFGFNDGNAFNNGIYDFSKSIIWDVIEDAAYIKVNQHKLMPLAGPVHTSFDLDIRKIN